MDLNDFSGLTFYTSLFITMLGVGLVSWKMKVEIKALEDKLNSLKRELDIISSSIKRKE